MRNIIVQMASERSKSMSVLIKGMEMPKEDAVVIEIDASGNVYEVHDYIINNLRYETDAIEVKEPHGRLIEAEPLEHNCTKLFADVVKALPTVIEAEENDDE